MVRTARRLLIGCATALLASGCTQQVAGLAVLPYRDTPGPAVTLAVNADQLMLDLPRMRAITGAGEDLSVIPSMARRPSITWWTRPMPARRPRRGRRMWVMSPPAQIRCRPGREVPAAGRAYPVSRCRPK